MWGFVQELAEERAELKAAQRQLRHEHVQLLKDKDASQAKLEELRQKAVDVQMLKFGQVRPLLPSLISIFTLLSNLNDVSCC